jgi:hypothetical protein
MTKAQELDGARGERAGGMHCAVLRAVQDYPLR